jgi:hypothetical protein
MQTTKVDNVHDRKAFMVSSYLDFSDFNSELRNQGFRRTLRIERISFIHLIFVPAEDIGKPL